MTKKSKPRVWSLNPAEVSWGWNSTSCGKGGKFARKLKITSRHVFFTHEPTGSKVEGEIPAGNYSKKEMRAKKEELEKKLFSELELEVAKKLKIKGM